MVKEVTDVCELLHDDGHLDEDTVQLIRDVLHRVEDGFTNAQMYGYLGHRRRMAKDVDDRVRVRHVIEAIRSNRWGLKTAIEHVRQLANERRSEARRSREARQAFYDQIALVNSMIPENKRGRGGRRKGRRDNKRKSYRRFPGVLV